MAQEKRFDMAEEFAGLDFHSIRLEGRFVRTMETLAKQPDKPIWEASEDRAEAKAVCRMPGGMRALTGRKSSGRTGKQPCGACQAMAVLSWLSRIPPP
jgi:hypothetical protein